MQDKSGISPQALNSLALVRRLVRDFIWRHAGQIALAFLCMGIAAASTALRAWLMEPVLDRIFIARDASLLLLLGGSALVLALLKGFADYGQTVLMNRVGQRVIADVQKALFARLIRADLAYFNATSSGLLISRLTNDVGQLRSAVLAAATPMQTKASASLPICRAMKSRVRRRTRAKECVPSFKARELSAIKPPPQS
jgi:subfamily B ATP-binding cassette protein MsbA